MATIIRMPQLTADATAAIVQGWLVEPGSPVEAGQSVVEIETDKAVVEYEAESGGVVAALLASAGDEVNVGAPIAVIVAPGEDPAAALAEAGASSQPSAGTSGGSPAPLPSREEGSPDVPEPSAASGSGEPAVEVGTPNGGRLFATPLVRRLAAERGIDVSVVQGRGPNGRVTRRDLDAHLATVAANADQRDEPTVLLPAAAPEATREQQLGGALRGTGFTDVPHSGMRRAIARRLSESKATVPHFYLVAETRVDDLLALRASINAAGSTRISVNDLVLKAVAGALMDVPDANAIWTEDAVRRYDTVDLAVAVAVPNGLLTPVIRGADSLSVAALSSVVRDYAARARDGKLKQHELEGGAFSVSNLGMHGTREFTAIINPPHAGILAVGAATKRPAVDADGELGVATMMTVTLSADHRVLDGALAAEWLAAFQRRIENPLTTLL